MILCMLGRSTKSDSVFFSRLKSISAQGQQCRIARNDDTAMSSRSD